MGKQFLVEKEEPVFRCSKCRTQIVKSISHMDAGLFGLDLSQFADAYNVVIGEVVVSYANNVFNGYEVRCVNCCKFLGWKEPEELVYSDSEFEENNTFAHVYRFPYGCLIPPPVVLPPPPNSPDVQP